MSRGGWDRLVEQTLAYVRDNMEYMRVDAEGDSEIEKLFFAALLAAVSYGDAQQHIVLAPSPKDPALAERLFAAESSRDALILQRQVEFSWGRVDFVVSAFGHVSKTWRSLIVECDGHNFHDRTKEQASRDRARDRSAQLEGYEVFRFTGADLWRDPWGCAGQVLSWASRSPDW